jgi:hypothetical protein
MRAMAVGLVVALGCGRSEASCEMPAVLADIAGEGAEDCGTVAVDGDASVVDACAVGAFDAHVSFFAIYEQQGIDSAVSSGVVSDGTTVFLVSRDGDPSGGSHVGASVTRRTCANPTVTAGDAGHDVIDCEASNDTCSICGGSNPDCP